MYTPVRRSKHCTATLSTLYTAAAAGANSANTATPSDMDFIHGDNCVVIGCRGCRAIHHVRYRHGDGVKPCVTRGMQVVTYKELVT